MSDNKQNPIFGNNASNWGNFQTPIGPSINFNSNNSNNAKPGNPFATNIPAFGNPSATGQQATSLFTAPTTNNSNKPNQINPFASLSNSNQGGIFSSGGTFSSALSNNSNQNASNGSNSFKFGSFGSSGDAKPLGSFSTNPTQQQTSFANAGNSFKPSADAKQGDAQKSGMNFNFGQTLVKEAKPQQAAPPPSFSFTSTKPDDDKKQPANSPFNTNPQQQTSFANAGNQFKPSTDAKQGDSSKEASPQKVAAPSSFSFGFQKPEDKSANPPASNPFVSQPKTEVKPETGEKSEASLSSTVFGNGSFNTKAEDSNPLKVNPFGKINNSSPFTASNTAQAQTSPSSTPFTAKAANDGKSETKSSFQSTQKSGGINNPFMSNTTDQQKENKPSTSSPFAAPQQQKQQTGNTSLGFGFGTPGPSSFEKPKDGNTSNFASCELKSEQPSTNPVENKQKHRRTRTVNTYGLPKDFVIKFHEIMHRAKKGIASNEIDEYLKEIAPTLLPNDK
ncbi:hypothetical protein TRFO_01495 [Tritrichomonas foetus]|uniref:Uncharacterized protein n=1 Tax=Tritrichomonas foetus TaxID=1144522 RepID=A0A1J4JZ94_9EUKA|nr:hypothetical protein TRFO_01495 [Tritrichomonas foetus]|eukprot:OHT03808.1 hypothetical protein TRFO_01495 [Tritrichomonas foetus]